MSWRPAPTVRNPLLALRRVVEAPDLELVAGDGEPSGHPGDGRAAAWEHGESGGDRGGGFEGTGRLIGPVEPRWPGGSPVAVAERVELHARPVTTEHPPATATRGRRSRSRGRQEPKRSIPDRPVRALITSTPVVGASADPAGPEPDAVPEPGTSPSTVAHAAAGPWSTLPGAPASTPTLLRSAWYSPSGGAT